MKKLLTIGVLLLSQSALSNSSTDSFDKLSTCKRLSCEMFGGDQERDYCDPGYLLFEVYRSRKNPHKGYVAGIRGDGEKTRKNVEFDYYEESNYRKEGFRLRGEGLQTDPSDVFESNKTVEMLWRIDVFDDGFEPPVGTMNEFSCESVSFKNPKD